MSPRLVAFSGGCSSQVDAYSDPVVLCWKFEHLTHMSEWV